jgi:hypothetical protein
MAVVHRAAKSLSEFLRIASALSDKWEGPWFRGQDRASYGLTPRRYRYRWVDEDEIRSEFKRRATQVMAGTPPRSEWERYFLMQHYGLPTRLLDWSEGALLALHFALGNRGRNDAAVWVFDPFWLNGEVIENSKLLPDPEDRRDRTLLRTYLPDPFPTRRPIWPESPIALQPPHIDRRIAAQLSSFTIHGKDPLGLETVASRSKRARLAKITIPRRAMGRMREQLLDSGITETTVYPDLFGLGLELTRLNTGPLIRRISSPPSGRPVMREP